MSRADPDIVSSTGCASAGSRSSTREREEGVRSAAAPAQDSSGEVVAALNISVNATRVSMRRLLGGMVPLLHDTAAPISADLGQRAR